MGYTILLSLAICTVALQSQSQAQAPVELHAGLGYARLFDAGGVSLAANVVRSVTPPPPPSPVEDLVGSEWGWGTGLELGFRVGLAGSIRGQTSVQLLYRTFTGRNRPMAPGTGTPGSAMLSWTGKVHSEKSG